MRTRLSLQIAACCAIAFTTLGLGGAQATKVSPSKAAPVPFSKVSPLIQAKCAGCHNDTRHSGGVNLSSYKAIMKGGEHGALVVAKHPEKSPLILYVDGTKKPRMPLGPTPLSTAEIASLKKWVAAGAAG